MEKLTLQARVVHKDSAYAATIDNLSLMGKGDTVQDAQDDLVVKFETWVRTYPGQGTLEEVLAAAGYDRVDEATELELEFVELPEDYVHGQPERE